MLLEDLIGLGLNLLRHAEHGQGRRTADHPQERHSDPRTGSYRRNVAVSSITQFEARVGFGLDDFLGLHERQHLKDEG